MKRPLSDTTSDSDLEEGPKLSNPRYEHEPVHLYHRHGDIAIRSDDGMILMDDSWGLADASTVFKDMFELPRPTLPHHPTPASPLRPILKSPSATKTAKRPRSHLTSTDLQSTQTIDVDYPSSVLDQFLNLVNVSRPAIPTTSDLSQSLALFDLCQKFDVKPAILGMVRDRLLIQTYDRQWKLLIWADKRNDSAMAKEALRRMTKVSFLCYEPASSTQSKGRVTPRIESARLQLQTKGRKGIPWHALRRLQPACENELLRLILQIKESNADPDTFFYEVTRDWQKVAENFNPR
ncbi:hypothetical protein I316_02025 [Kwoniella heveanensis BCC8398]|uniref:Uncharacterized protein n=1 Tax=Kwoniella heveanensis BCC8398 TaxID=1296120 RepID=A0A1B9GYR1_9TREE|nr:hypothetical protein I316_02025 [Kwoniella heveanensis BCC8398]